MCQLFTDDFESYLVNDYLAASSTRWRTWSGTSGGTEDLRIVDDSFYSGSQSIFVPVASGRTMSNIVLPFGGMIDSGTLKLSARFLVPSGKEAYFNIQGDTALGTSTAADCFMAPWGVLYINGLSANYPSDQWFEIRMEADLSANIWNFYLDGAYQGSFMGYVSSAAYFNLTGAGPDCTYWVDDVSFCCNSSCNPDISMNAVSVVANPMCTNRSSNVSLRLFNNGPGDATGFRVGLQMAGQSTIEHDVVLDKLASGRDTFIILDDLFKTHLSGDSIEVKAINITHDREISNDTTSTFIDILQAPYGSELMQGFPFDGQLRLGTHIQPDLVTPGKTNTYELRPPAGYTNSGHSVLWNIHSVEAITVNGTPVPATEFTVTLPTDSTNGVIAYTGSDTFLDSTIILAVNLRNAPNACDSFVKRVIRVVPMPETNFTVPAPLCSERAIVFDNTTTIHSGLTTYMWYFGDNDSSDLVNPVHTYGLPGTYTVTLIATSFPYGIVKDTSIIIQVGKAPVTGFTVINACQGTAISFQDGSVAGSGTTSYEWTFGDGTGSTSMNVSHMYSAPGIYSVRLITTADGCADTLVKNAYQFAGPVADFNAPSAPVCARTEVFMKNTSAIVMGNYGAYWNFGDNHVSAITDGSHTYDSAGSFTVKMVAVSDFGCRDSISKTIVIKPSPVPDFTTGKLCSRTSTVFTNQTPEAIANPVYTWTFSDGYSSQLKHVTRSWPADSTYHASLRADYSNGCSGTITKSLVVMRQAKADFNVQDICSGNAAVFVNTTEGDNGSVQYSWNFGNGSTSTLQAPTHVYNVPGVYTVRLIALNGGECNDTVSRNITVKTLPVCDFSHVNSGFMNIRFTPANSSYRTYAWFFGDGDTSNVVNPDHQYTQNNYFDVTMQATNAEGCSCEVTKRIQVNTGIHSFNTMKISVHPNPNNGIFEVSQYAEGQVHVEVFTATGVRIYSQISDDEVSRIDLGAQANGIYMLKITKDGEMSTRQIIVNR